MAKEGRGVLLPERAVSREGGALLFTALLFLLSSTGFAQEPAPPAPAFLCARQALLVPNQAQGEAPPDEAQPTSRPSAEPDEPVAAPEGSEEPAPPEAKEERDASSEDEEGEPAPSAPAPPRPPWQAEALERQNVSFAALPSLCLDAAAPALGSVLPFAYRLDQLLGNLVPGPASDAELAEARRRLVAATPQGEASIVLCRPDDVAFREAAEALTLEAALRANKARAGIGSDGGLRLWLVVENLSDKPLVVRVPLGSILRFGGQRVTLEGLSPTRARELDGLAALAAQEELYRAPADSPWQRFHTRTRDDLRFALEAWHFWLASGQRELDDLRLAFLRKAQAGGLPPSQAAPRVAQLMAKVRLAHAPFAARYQSIRQTLEGR